MNAKPIGLNCISCGAKPLPSEYACSYCGGKLADQDGKVIEKQIPLKDFGWEGNFPLILTLIIGTAVYLWGWKYEEHSLLNTQAIIIWSGILPVWILIMTIIWKTKNRFTYLIGFLFSLFIFIMH